MAVWSVTLHFSRQFYFVYAMPLTLAAAVFLSRSDGAIRGARFDAWAISSVCVFSFGRLRRLIIVRLNDYIYALIQRVDDYIHVIK